VYCDGTNVIGVDNIAAVHNATNKATAVDADEVGYWDSVTGIIRKMTWANIKTVLKAYFDALYVSKTSTTGSAVLPAGTTAQRDGTPADGYTRFNSTLTALEAWYSSAWNTVATTAFVTTGKLPTITATVASNALTIGASSIYLDFRSATLGSGTVSTINAAPANLVVPSTATLGTISAQLSRLIVIEMNNAGVAELAVVNISGGNNLDETTLISTTAISAAATASNVIYSTTARTSLPFRVVGFIESTQATAGTWATAPSTIQGAGGNALTAMSSLGYGQTWQNVIGSRVAGTTYYNTTGKPISINVLINSPSSGYATLTVAGIQADNFYTGTGIVAGSGMSAVIPSGASYIVAVTGGATVNGQWSELR
jgi:hypothetical protein